MASARGAVRTAVLLTRRRTTVRRTLGTAVRATVLLTRRRTTVRRTLGTAVRATVLLTRRRTTIGRTLGTAGAAGADVVVVEPHHSPLASDTPDPSTPSGLPGAGTREDPPLT
ncbi:hypothetical protein O7627_18045 [Solwaraspora sp. WMMD1047]|nr:hypothetical protein [Solwaraspora sp. WMMD1047]MDG4831201.1 hypothetical protein [Solwaraspora sp. WMMD1047]